MHSLQDKKNKWSLMIFLAAVFAFIVCWAAIQPYNVSPDEEMRFQIVEYIINHGSLPDGRSPEIRNNIWGISYGYYPILAYMIMAIPAKIVSLFTSDHMAILIAARLVNAFFGTVTAYFVVKISEILFKGKIKYLFIVLIVFLPQMVFINSYVNNDSIAVMSTAWICYVCVRTFDKGWTKGLCISYALAVSVCALSYYNAYGFILCSMIFFFATVFIGYKGEERKAKYLGARVLLIVVIVAVAAGWWFIRNAVLYDGDFLGRSIMNQQAEIYAADGYKPSQIISLSEQGYGLLDLISYSRWGGGNWIKLLAASFVAAFGYLDFFAPEGVIIFYYIIYAIGFIGCILSLKRLFKVRISEGGQKIWSKRAIFNWCMLLDAVITCALLVYYNLYIDVQAQGRYLLPAIIPIMYFVAMGLQRILELIIRNKKIREVVYVAMSVALVILVLVIYITVFYPEYGR